MQSHVACDEFLGFSRFVDYEILIIMRSLVFQRAIYVLRGHDRPYGYHLELTPGLSDCTCVFEAVKRLPGKRELLQDLVSSYKDTQYSVS